jgi:hypothetical protein
MFVIYTEIFLMVMLSLKVGRKELKDWKAKQLPLCNIHHKMLHNNTLNKESIDETYILNV